MINPLLAGGRWFAHRPLRTQILALTLVSAVVIIGLVGSISLRSRLQQAEDEAVDWAVALSVMAARTAAAPMLEKDYTTLELLIHDLIALPGVKSVTLVQPGAEIAMEARYHAEGSTTTYPINKRAPVPTAAFQRDETHVHAVSALMYETSTGKTAVFQPELASRYGWIEIEMSYSDRLASAQRDWITASLISGMLIMILVWLMSVFLRRVFGPISQLARFAANLTGRPGEVIRMRWGSLEVRELGRSLNEASRQLAERIQAEQIRLSRLQGILDTAADAILGITADGVIRSANPAAERIFGVPMQELLGYQVEKLLKDTHAAEIASSLEYGMLVSNSTTRIAKLEINAYRHDGTEFPVEVMVGEVLNDQELRYTCIVRDLSDTKLAEEYLALYSRAVDCAINGIAISDARRHPQPFVYVNPSFTRITGYAPHEILGRDGSILEGPDTNRSDIDLLYRAQQNGSDFTVVLKNYRKGGALFHNKLSVSPVRNADGEITHYINIIEDVSGQIEVKQRLIERTARLNATFDLSPDGFAVFDKEGDLVTSNPSFRAMVGDIPGWCSLKRFDSWFRTLCEEPDGCRPIEEAIRDRRKDIIAIARPAPKILEREIRKNVGGSGETILYFRDVTHQVEVDRIKSEFLATAAHELRTPLASILGFTELLLHRKYNEDRQKDMLATVHRQGTLLQNLIQELLDLSRIEARQGKDFHIVAHRLADIVRNAVGGITNADAGRVVQVQEPMEDLLVMADATKIEQALTNLLSNAFKYSPNGGTVSLRVESAEHEGEPVALVHISDQGIGMTPEQLSRVFERFYRADTSGNIPGTGLGLNLVREIAQIHDGDVTLSSQFGVGTVATLRLKLASLTTEEPVTANA